MGIPIEVSRYMAIKGSKGGKNRWAGLDKEARSAIMTRVSHTRRKKKLSTRGKKKDI